MGKSPIGMRWTSAAREIFLVAGLFALFAALTLPMFVSTESRAVRPRDGQIAIFPSLLAERPILLHGEWTIERFGRAGSGTRIAAPMPGGWEGLRLPNGETLGAGEAILYRLTLHHVPAGDYPVVDV